MAQTLGRYHIISELGRGGMGVVYKALDPKLERFIAIKCLSEELSDNEIVVSRFLREARNVAALNHPNIAQIFVADEHEGKPYFVMEYVDGESLADFIDREGQCSPEMARRVTEQAANALAAAAEEGIVHRDVKPGNIMLDRRGRAVLTDFGIACVVTEQSESGQKSVMGTPGYLPPEALTGDLVDARSDMFALGAVCFEMLAGERLMPGHDLKQTFSQFASQGFPDLSAVEGKADDRVVGILRKLLAVKPEDRYDNWQELLADMAPLKTGRTGPVERSDSGPSTAEREVTAALATARTDAATRPTATATDATAVLEQATEQHHPVPVPEQRRPSHAGRWLAALALVIVALGAAGFGLTRMDPPAWNRVTAWLPSSDPETAPVSTEAHGETTAQTAPPEDLTETAGRQTAGAAPAARASQAVVEEEAADDAIEPDLAEAIARAPNAAEADPDSTAEPGAEEAPVPEGATAAQDSRVPADSETALAMVGQGSIQPEAATTAAPAPQPAREPDPLPPPNGVVVIGIGDPVIADPMVREIENALRSGNRPLVQRGFISGYRNHIDGEQVDLAGLATPAMDAGARYAVIVRAMPAGERELRYYNRVDTAFITQLEATTYDLYAMQQLGSSPVEQIEFTPLNATERAIASVRPWLDGIRRQLQ